MLLCDVSVLYSDWLEEQVLRVIRIANIHNTHYTTMRKGNTAQQSARATHTTAERQLYEVDFLAERRA